jgi:hypothetical protein
MSAVGTSYDPPDEPCGAFNPRNDAPDAPLTATGERYCRCGFERVRHDDEADNIASEWTELLMAAAIKHEISVDELLTRVIALSKVGG